MNEGIRDFCVFRSTAALAMAVLSYFDAIISGSRKMYIQTALFGLIGVCAALAVAMWM